MKQLRSLVHEALVEDIGQADITTNATIHADTRCHASLIAKQDGVLSGISVYRVVFEMLEAEISEWWSLQDGAHFTRGQRIAHFQGRTRAVCSGERVALNFLQRLSGIATLAAEFRKQVEGINVRLCDTRKTTPLMRKLEKEAVVHGGCSNHRYALFDGVLIKENHITGAGGIRQAIDSAKLKTHHLMKIGIEVTTLDELREALDAKADAILLDNMSIEQMREAVVITGDQDVLLEASGNITIERVREVAATGVDIVSVGALTHSAPAVDLTLIIKNA